VRKTDKLKLVDFIFIDRIIWLIAEHYNRGVQSAALKLVFAALGPFCHLKETLQKSN
jgi:hypothetical protein